MIFFFLMPLAIHEIGYINLSRISDFQSSLFFFIIDEDDTLDPLGLCSLDLVLAR